MTAVPIPTATAFAKLDEMLSRVKEGSRRFARLSIDERIALVRSMRDGYYAIAEESVRAACAAKGLDFDSPTSGEEWLAGPLITLRILRQTEEVLEEVKRYGAPRIQPSWLRQLPDGRLSVRVFPPNALDAMLLAKHTAEVYLEPGITAANLSEHQASFYKRPHEGRLCVVLGAGNVNAIPPTDVVYKMFVEGTACVLKMNPVNAYIGPLLERAFRSAIDKGFFAVAYGGADEGGYLVSHPLVDEVHITGSDKTHDLLVWGPPGPEREERKRRNEPLLKKAITSELGNISPVIVVPGPYADDELRFQAFSVAGMVANNASFNCNSAKLLVTPKAWEGRPKLWELIAQGLERAEVRHAYYPGAEERWKLFTEGRPGVKLVGQRKPGHLPWALISDVDPNASSDRVFHQEPWCAVLSETGLSGSDPASFLEEAVKFVNEKVWGTLNVTLVVHPRTMKEPRSAEAVEKAISKLRYGTVAVNTWPAAGFGLGVTPWGAHPSSTLEDIQSGKGWVHNVFMLEGIEKCVLRAPVKTFPVPTWFPGHRTLHQLGRKLVELQMDPSWLKVPGVAATAMRG